ncbi:MAG: hypothetical protein H7Y30_04440, partial [Pyrinomonadaceae bacterium]|nr:hypothetical protein [Pyrinomonadaceae bacterium]
IVFAPMLRPGSQIPLAARIMWVAGIIFFFLAHRARLAERWGGAIAVAALVLMVAYWGMLSVLHRRALLQAQTVAARLASQNGETPDNIAAMPTLANPLRWQTVATTERATYRFDVSLSGAGEERIVGETVRYEKLRGVEAKAYERAAQDEGARVFLDFARFPVARVEGDCLSNLLVQFADLRYTEPGRSRGTFSHEAPVECER